MYSLNIGLWKVKGEEETIIDAFLKNPSRWDLLGKHLVYILTFFFNFLKGILFLQREKVNSF